MFKIKSLSILTVVYTIGHIVIASVCNYLITGAALSLAAIDALIEPAVNGVWFYLLFKVVFKNSESESTS